MPLRVALIPIPVPIGRAGIGETLTLAARNGTAIKPNSLSLFFNMKTFRVQFVDLITAESEEAAYDILLEYLSDCVKDSDVVAFDFQEEPVQKELVKEEQTH